MGKRFLIFTLFLLLLLFLLPEKFPLITGVDRIAWEVFYNLRYYYSLCLWKNPTFLYSPFSHPLPTLLGFPFSHFLVFLPPWKRIAFFNLLLLLLSVYFIWKSCTIWCEKKDPILIFFLFILQPVFLFWLTAFQGYFTGLLFLSLGVYYYIALKKWWGIIFFGLLPLCRHELGIFLLTPFIITIKRKEGLKGIVLLIAPFLVYYPLLSLAVWKNPFTLFFIHRITKVKCFSSLLGYFELSHKLTPFLYYGPLMWLFPVFIYFLRRERELFYLSLNSLLLLPVAYLSRIIIPLFLFSLLGFLFMETYLRKSFRIFLIAFILSFQVLWIVNNGWRAEGGDSVYPYRDYGSSYNCIRRDEGNFDYFFFPNRESFIVRKDESCVFAKKLLVSQIRSCRGKEKITFLLPEQMLLLEPEKIERVLSSKKVYTVIDRRYNFLKRITSGEFEIVRPCRNAFVVRLRKIYRYP